MRFEKKFLQWECSRTPSARWTFLIPFFKFHLRFLRIVQWTPTTQIAINAQRRVVLCLHTAPHTKNSSTSSIQGLLSQHLIHHQARAAAVARSIGRAGENHSEKSRILWMKSMKKEYRLLSFLTKTNEHKGPVALLWKKWLAVVVQRVSIFRCPGAPLLPLTSNGWYLSITPAICLVHMSTKSKLEINVVSVLLQKVINSGLYEGWITFVSTKAYDVRVQLCKDML